MEPSYKLVHELSNGGAVYLRPGRINKNRRDFHVRYKGLNQDEHDLPHAALVKDVYCKRKRATPQAFETLLNHMLRLIANVEAVETFPPVVVQFAPEHLETLRQAGLEGVPGFDLEVLLVAFELIQVQEKTNYPKGTLPIRLFTAIRDEPDNLVAVSNLTVFGYRESRMQKAVEEHWQFRDFRDKYRSRDALLAELIGWADFQVGVRGIADIRGELLARDATVPEQLFEAIQNEPTQLLEMASLAMFGDGETRPQWNPKTVDEFDYWVSKCRERDRLLKRFSGIMSTRD